MTGKTISHYKILEKLGEGGMGVVYKAHDTKLDRTVAVKFLPSHLVKSETDLARFVQEARSAAALNHPNACTIYEIHDEGENPYIVMEYVEGRTLRHFAETQNLVSLQKTIDITVQIADALKAAHARGIIHRDIKSENIMITEDGRVKVMDFGLAKKMGSVTLTQTGSTLGTVAYMSPEQARGDSVDERTDIWSLGVILYEMLTGQRPFRGEYEQALIYSILNEEPHPFPEECKVPEYLKSIIRQMLTRDRENRIASADHLIQALKKKDGELRTKDKKGRTASTFLKVRPICLLFPVLLIGIVYLILGPGQGLLKKNVPSIGVLYLKNLGDEEDEYFSYGITEDIIIDLSKAGLIRVPAMNDILAYRDSEKTLAEIADDLNVRYILTGSLRNEEASLRLALQLVEPARGVNLWGDRWDEPLAQVPAVKGKIIREVVSALGLRLNQSVRNQIERDPAIRADAYEFYLKAKYRYDQMQSREDLVIARGLYYRAIELDSSFIAPRIELGETYYMTGEADRAMEHYEEALAMASRMALPLQKASALMSMGVIYRLRAQYEEAFEHFLESLQIARESGDIMTEGLSLRYLGVIHDDQSRYPEAMNYFQQALKIARDLKNEQMEYTNLNSIGVMYSNMSDINKALEYFEKSLAIRIRLGHQRGAAIVLFNMATMEYGRKNYFKAVDLHNRSLEIFQNLGDPTGTGYALGGLGNIYYSLGQFTEALDFLEQSLELLRQVGDRSAEGYALSNIGNVYNEMEDFSLSRDYLRQALEIFYETHDVRMQGHVLGNMGILSYMQNDFPEARTYFQQAVDLMETIEADRDVWKPASFLALCKAETEDTTGLSADLTRLEAEIDSVGRADVDPIVFWNLSRIYGLLGDEDREKQHLKTAYDKVIQTGNQIKKEADRQRFMEGFRDLRKITEEWEKRLNR